MTKGVKMTLIVVLAGFALLLATAWICVTQPFLPVSGGSQIPLGVEAAQLEAHVRMLSERFFPRNEAHPEVLDRVAEYIGSQLREATGKSPVEQTYQVGGKTYSNVILRLGPDTRERLVVGAHYDAWEELPAADDNASGVAGLIELGRLLRSTPLAMTVELVAYTLEEPPHFRTNNTGSAVHVRSLQEQNVDVDLMVSLEMIGFFSDVEGSQHFPVSFLKLFYPSQGDFIAVVGKLGQGETVRRVKGAMRGASLLPVYSISAPEWVPGIDWSDHRYYWEAGYPAVMITDTAHYRNPNYHSPQDLPETLDYDRMAMVVQGVYGVVTEFCGVGKQ